MDIARDLDPKQLRWLTPGRTWEEDSIQRAFAYLGHARWRDASAALEREEQLVRDGHHHVPEADDEDVIARDIVEEAFQILDLGVVAAVLALNAAGCRTLYSCRGGDEHAQRHPVVTFRARPFSVPTLLAAAEDARCGLENAEHGGVILYAASVDTVIRFARSLIGRRAELKKQREEWHRVRQSVRRHAQRGADQMELF
jgi:hypothetical protein